MLVRQLQKNLVKENKYNRVGYVYIQLYFYVFMTTLIDINQVGRGVTMNISQEIVTANTPELITTTGAGTWTKPAGITLVMVECWGGGGSGGNSSVNDAGGGGGGGGGYARSIKTYPSDSQSIPYAVGAANQDTTWDNGEIAARAGTFGNDAVNTTEEAGGGFGGGFVPEGPSALQPNIGDVTYIGGDGANGWAIDALSGATAFSAGGGAAGSTGPGGTASPNAEPPIGGTGTSEFGGNGANGTIANVNFSGLNGSNYGGGGSGAQKVSGPTRFGGAGAQGRIRITTYNISRRGVPIQSV